MKGSPRVDDGKPEEGVIPGHATSGRTPAAYARVPTEEEVVGS